MGYSLLSACDYDQNYWISLNKTQLQPVLLWKIVTTQHLVQPLNKTNIVQAVLVCWAVLSLSFSFLSFSHTASEQQIKNTNNLTPRRASAQNGLTWLTDLQSAHWAVLFFYVRKDIDRGGKKKAQHTKNIIIQHFQQDNSLFFLIVWSWINNIRNSRFLQRWWKVY